MSPHAAHHRFSPGPLLALLALAVVSCLTGCGTPPSQPVLLKDYTLLLGDTTNPDWQYTFLVEDRQVLLMVEPAAVKKTAQVQPRFFAAKDMSLDLYQSLRNLSGLPADAPDPEPPATAACWRALYLHARPGELPTAPAESSFQADTAFKRDLDKLRAFVQQPAHAINGLPNWAFHTETAARRLNLEGR